MSISKHFRTLILSMAFIIGLIQMPQAQDYKSSAGIKLGTYTAATFSYYTSENASLDIFAGITREANQSDFIIGGFYKINMSVSANVPTLKWYVGIGIFVNLESAFGEDNITIAPTSLTGMEYTLEHTPVNFFLELSPHYVTGSLFDSGFGVHANLGVRYVLSTL